MHKAQMVSTPYRKDAASCGPLSALRPRVIALARRLAAPVALLLVLVHIVLTCSSWRYTATLLVLDMSPSMLLASVALLCFFSSAEPQVGPQAVVADGEVLGSMHPQTRSGLRSMAIRDALAEDAEAVSARAHPLRRLWRKVLQVATSPQQTNSTRLPGNLLRRHGQALSTQAHPRTSTDSGSQASSGHKRSLLRQRSRGGGEGSRWAPSMSRITSGQHLTAMDDTSSSISTSVASRRAGERLPQKDRGCDLPLVPHMGHLAVDCVHHDATLPHADEITQVITSQHLLQFGALLGESSAELALSQAGLAEAQGREPDCLLGATDNEAHWAQGWEQVAHEICLGRGLHYCAWRRYLRKGLYMYKSRTVFDGVTPQQLVAFHFDGEYKVAWDESCTELRPIPPPRCALARNPSPTPDGAPPSGNVSERPSAQGSHSSAGGALNTALSVPMNGRKLSRSGTGGSGGYSGLDVESSNSNSTSSTDWQIESSFGRSAYLYARTRFPAPMAQREYVYARRVWAKADDGGCYMLSKAAQHPRTPAPGCRVVRVQDFVSGTVIRASSLGDGHGPAAEMITMYFEDSHVASGIMNLGVRKALWPMVQKMAAALRKHVVSPQGAALQVAASAALQQACMQPASGAPPLRRCMSVAGSCRGSMDGSGGEAAALQLALSLQVPVSKGGDGVRQAGVGVLVLSTGQAMAPRRYAGSRAAAAVAGLLHNSYRRLAALVAAVLGVLVTTLRCSLLAWLADAAWRLQRSASQVNTNTSARTSAHVTSHPVDDLSRDNNTGSTTRRWGRKLAARLALVAVRAVSLPLAHQMLSRSSAQAATAHAGYSRSESMSSRQGGGTVVAQHGGRSGAAGTQASMSESTARVRRWLDPPAAPANDYLLAHTTELMQHHAAMQQLQARRQQQLQSQPGGGRTGGSGGGGMSMRPALGAVVVDGVPLAWERPPAAAAAVSVDNGKPGGRQGAHATRNRRQ